MELDGVEQSQNSVAIFIEEKLEEMYHIVQESELDGVEQSRDSVAIFMEEKLEEMHHIVPESKLDGVEQSRDNVAIFIEEKLEEMHHIVPEWSIHRIPKRLLQMKCDAYMPRVISIGPFHHDKHKFKATEELKLRFFNSYRCCVVNMMINVQDIVKKARGWEKTAREYYSEPINMESDEFVKMMVLDGCFIVGFMITNFTDLFCENENKVHSSFTQDKIHSSFYEAIKFDICVDLILLENQLPFFVLQGLFDLISPTSNTAFFPIIDLSSELVGESCIDDLFELFVNFFSNTQLLPIERGVNILSYNMLNNQKPRHLVDFLSFYFVPLENKNNIEDQKYLPPSATQLSEAGVVFKKVELQEDETYCIMEISFKDGTLNIPSLLIDDNFETWVRNLLAFGQFSCTENIENISRPNATCYFLFLDDLMSTEKYVNLLVKEGIIINAIGGSDKEISQLFNNLCKNIALYGNSCFNHIAKDLRQHCERRRNMWMASLKHNYFNTSWALISFLAATFLILLTLLQTIFTAISTFK